MIVQHQINNTISGTAGVPYTQGREEHPTSYMEAGVEKPAAVGVSRLHIQIVEVGQLAAGFSNDVAFGLIVVVRGRRVGSAKAAVL